MKNRQISSEKLNIRIVILQSLVLAILFSVILAFFFRVVDGADWFFIDGGWLTNLGLLFILGFGFSSYYSVKDYYRFNMLSVIVTDQTITYYSKERKMSFSKDSFYDIKYETQLYGLFGFIKIIMTFKKSDSRRKNYQSFLMKKEQKTLWLQLIEDWKPTKKRGKL